MTHDDPDKPPKCPNCLETMVLKDGRRGRFWGCSQFHATGCRGARQYSGPTLPFAKSLRAMSNHSKKPYFPAKKDAELNFAAPEVLEAFTPAAAQIPFCPDDPTEEMVAPRDPELNFVGGKIR